MPEACECCGEIETGRNSVLSLDHDHLTGVFRGWLCNKCNLGIGLLGDTAESVEKAVTYLRLNLRNLEFDIPIDLMP